MQRNIVLTAVVILVIGAIALIELSGPKKADIGSGESVVLMDVAEKAKLYDEAKEITTPDGFINVDAVTVAEHIGKNVVLVDFWTYSCINCQRTLPYLNAWHEEYADDGLVILGVHTPEFAFEEEYDNVLAAVKKFGIEYAVVLDNDYSTWQAYKNKYWPRKYLIDIDGYIVYDHIGEGGYEETEDKIRELLIERAVKLGLDSGLGSGTDVAATSVAAGSIGTPEIYFGAARNDHLGNGVAGTAGVQTFTLPDDIEESNVYLEGTWNVTLEYAESVSSGARILLPYHAKDVYFVASSKAGVSVEVLLDGKPADALAGSDVDGGIVEIQEEGLYKLIEGNGYGSHILELRVQGEGLRAFTFTFG